jgi:uncharacterized membrane protein YbaN (DUF454 family)
MTNKTLGKYIFYYRVSKAIPLKSKITALSLLWLGILASIYIAPLLWVKILLFFIASGVTLHISSLKTMKKDDLLLCEKEYQNFIDNF